MISGLVARLKQQTGSVRVRTTLGAVLVVGAALLAAAIAMVLILRWSLTEDVRTAAGLRADTVVELLTAGTQTDSLRVSDSEDEFVQVLDEQGRVVGSSSNVSGEPALASPEPGDTTDIDVPFEDDPFIAIARTTTTSDGTYTIVVGRTVELVEESSRVVIGVLLGGVPLLLLVVAAVTWRVVGRALAPVESIRSEVESISTGELHRRVPGSGSKDEIARLSSTMNEMLARLERGHARQQRFVSDASHEFRSPVASIRQHAEVTLSHPGSASAEELAQNVLEEDLRLQRLVEDLLLLAKMDEHGRALGPEPVDLDDLVFEEVDRMRQTADKLIDTSGVSGGRVRGDRRQLVRLVGNLIENAIRHANSKVVLGLGERDGEVRLSVEDDGRGVAAAERDRIFDRFVRLEAARDRDSGGSGLGLAIVAEVAAQHGGAAEVGESSLGGARFDVRLPGVPD